MVHFGLIEGVPRRECSVRFGVTKRRTIRTNGHTNRHIRQDKLQQNGLCSKISQILGSGGINKLTNGAVPHPGQNHKWQKQLTPSSGGFTPQINGIPFLMERFPTRGRVSDGWNLSNKQTNKQTNTPNDSVLGGFPLPN